MKVMQKEEDVVRVQRDTEKVIKVLESDPVKLESMLTEDTQVVRSVLSGESLSDEELKQINEQVKDNNLVKLYLGANGQIDAKDLVELKKMAEDTSNPTRAAGISAFFDGKLDVNDLLAVAGLLGAGSNKPQSNSGMNLLTTLLGGGQQQTQQSSQGGSLLSALFGGQPQQTQQVQQTQNPANFLNLLLGGGQTQQQTQQVKPQNANNILNLLLGGNKPQQTQQTQQAQQANPLNSLFGFNTQQTTTPNNNSNSTYNLLGTLLGGSPAGNSYANQLFTLDQNTGNVNSNVNVTNSNGQIDLSTLFNIAGTLLGK